MMLLWQESTHKELSLTNDKRAKSKDGVHGVSKEKQYEILALIGEESAFQA